MKENMSVQWFRKVLTERKEVLEGLALMSPTSTAPVQLKFLATTLTVSECCSDNIFITGMGKTISWLLSYSSLWKW